MHRDKSGVPKIQPSQELRYGRTVVASITHKSVSLDVRASIGDLVDVLRNLSPRADIWYFLVHGFPVGDSVFGDGIAVGEEGHSL